MPGKIILEQYSSRKKGKITVFTALFIVSILCGQGLLRDVLELVKSHGSNGKSRYSIKPLEEKLSFDKGFYVFIRAIQLLVSRNKGVVLV